MSKRFADTDKYKKAFIRGLPGAYKLLWDYICLDCDHAGIWQVDFEVAQIYLGKDMPVTKESALCYFNNGEERIKVLNGGSKWFIQPFVDFQYGVLNPANRVHASILAMLSKESLNKALTRPLQGSMDKDKDKDSSLTLIIPDYISPNIWESYLNMRKAKRAKPTHNAKELILKDLAKLHEQGHDANKVLEQSIKQNWTGVFPLKDNFVKPNPSGSKPIPGKYGVGEVF